MNHTAGIEVTSDNLTSRAGLALFARYLDQIGLGWFLSRWLGPLRKSAKGLPAAECVRQVLLFLVDGTSRHLTHFDSLKCDSGYAATIERRPEDLASSHAVKRFIRSIGFGRIWLIRKLLQELFILAKPKVVILDLDVMVMDNDDADKREGVSPTYKKVRGFAPLQMVWGRIIVDAGFAPLQMVWGRIIVDAVFRAGHHHSNHKDSTEKMVAHAVRLIRRRYSKTAPILIRQDAGYFDQKLFDLYEDLGADSSGCGVL